MSWKGSKRRCAALAAVFIFGSTLELLAQEKAGAVTVPESVVEPRAIEAAKKEFDAVKASGDAALQRPADAPRMSIPEWHGAAPISNLKPARTAPTPDPKSATWLIDAMQKRPNPRDPHTSQERSERGELLGILRDGQPRSPSSTETSRRAEVRDKNDQKRAGGTEVVNPLARHLGDWMTPTDFALLKPGLTESLGSVTTPKPTQTFGAVGSAINTLPAPGSEAMVGLLAPVQGSMTSRVPRENPYLASLAPIAPSIPPLVSIAKPVPPLPVPTPAIPSFPPPATSPSPQSKVPEFAKPLTDEKYFKQLKRF